MANSVTARCDSMPCDRLRKSLQFGRSLSASLLRTLSAPFPVQPQSLSDLGRLPFETLNFYQATRQIVPGSCALAAAMTAPLPLDRSKLVIEFGPGTGVMTRKLLQRMPFDAKLVTFEINARLAGHLRRTLPDRRLQIVENDAQSVGDVLREIGCQRVDGVVSSLGLTTMPEDLKHRIFQSLLPFMDDRTVLTQFQYLNAMQISESGIFRYDAMTFLKRYFTEVSRQVVLLNLPPVNVFVCRQLTRVS